MNTIVKTAISAALGCVMSVGAAFADANITLAYVLSGEDSVYKDAADTFKRIVEEETDGEVTVTIFPNGVLGGEVKVLQGMRTGGIGAAMISTSPVENIMPELAVLSLPYLFDSLEDTNKVLQGPFGDEVLDKLSEVGLIGLSFVSPFERNVYTRETPVRTAKDLENLKLRVIQSPAYVDTYKALGALPTPMAYPEVYLGLEKGVIDGTDNSPDAAVQDLHVEVIKYYNLTRMHYMPLVFVMSKTIFDGLTPDQQEIVRRAGREAGKASLAYYDVAYPRSLDIMRDMGIEIIETDVTELRERALKTWDIIREGTPNMDENIEKIRAALAAAD